MNAFADAAAALAADTNLGVDATWTSREGGPPVSLRVVASRPEDAFGALDGPQSSNTSTLVMVPAAALCARPEEGDGIALGGACYVVAEVRQDVTAASWTLHLRRAA